LAELFPIGVYIAIIIGATIVAVQLPGWIKRLHVRAQNRLLDRCRALYVLGGKAIELGDNGAARDYLHRIRRIEARWRYGKSVPYRTAKAAYALTAGIAAYIGLRYSALFLGGLTTGIAPSDMVKRLEDLWVFLPVYGLMAAIFVLCSYFGEWTNKWAIADCGDRLQRLLNAGRHIATVPEPEPGEGSPFADGLSPLEIFGLGADFTLGQLARARRRLVTELHPDRWHDAKPSIRLAREEALKRVNSAYDELRPVTT
jgi:hypothetical protein